MAVGQREAQLETYRISGIPNEDVAIIEVREEPGGERGDSERD